ncbi:MAG TPA: hypothetical protein VHF25_02550 [Nitriliruptorales bacterium]|nr:hypothetical protein [Nitriliruptorales bacterium]
MDLCDLRWAEVRRGQPPLGKVGDDWAIITEFSAPSPSRYVRLITTFVRVDASVQPGFGDERLPQGLVAIIGGRPA